MNTPMIDRAMAQLEKYYDYDWSFFRSAYDPTKIRRFSNATDIVEISNEASRASLISAVIHGLENIFEDATDPQTVLAAIEAVRRIK